MKNGRGGWKGSDGTEAAGGDTFAKSGDAYGGDVAIGTNSEATP